MFSRTVRRPRILALPALAIAAALALSGCSPSTAAQPPTPAPVTKTVSIEDNHGKVDVPLKPQRVVALDNHAFETLSVWNVPLVAAPKGIMGAAWPKYTNDKNVGDVGAHREPNLEAVIAAKPDLIIAGYRFGDHYAKLKAQNPTAAVIDIAPRKGEELTSELKRISTILGEIFAQQSSAKQINDALDSAVAGAKGAYNGKDTVMGLLTSGGKIEYAAAGTGRSVGPVFPTLGLKPAIAQKGENNTHGDDISVEAIAQANPDWLIVLDRDASFAQEKRDKKSAPANELISGAEALKSVTAVKKKQVVILDPNFYLTEDIQAYTKLFEQLKGAFSGS